MIRETDRSFGVIPLKKENQQWSVLLVQQRAGHWGFPKGHPNPGESSIETAYRELFEETMLDVVELLDPIPLYENYLFENNGKMIDKIVEYFLARVDGEPRVDSKEIINCNWFLMSQAMEVVTFSGSKKICLEASNRLVELERCEESSGF